MLSTSRAKRRKARNSVDPDEIRFAARAARPGHPRQQLAKPAKRGASPAMLVPEAGPCRRAARAAKASKAGSAKARSAQAA
jgi:hypothetical protein